MKQLDARTYESTHFALFAGAGGMSLGLSAGQARVGVAHMRMRCLGGIDVWPTAMESFRRFTGVSGTVMDLFDREDYRAFHGREPPAGWREAEPADVLAAAGGECPDVLATSAPCLPADGLVVTADGNRAISTIRAGDRVLTHRGRLMPVMVVGRHQHVGQMYGFRLNGSVDVQEFTSEHPMWIRHVEYRSSGTRRALGESSFVKAMNVKVGDRIGFPVDQELAGTAQRFVVARTREFGRSVKDVALESFANNVDLWFLLGAYAGDGYRKGVSEVVFCCGPEHARKYNEIVPRLNRLGMSVHVDRNGGKSNVKVAVRNTHLYALSGAFGDGAANKNIPSEMFVIERPWLDAFMLGYRATDGSARGRRDGPRNELQAMWKIVSVSLPMLRSLQRLLLRTGTFGAINVAWPGSEQVIIGRTVRTLPRWEIVIRLGPKKRTIFEFIDGAVWTRVKSIQTRQTVEEVWNLDVEEDDTFCTPMMATHNCKGFSALLNGEAAASARYQALNRLTLRGLSLSLVAFADDPPALILFENVPRIQTRGADLVDTIVQLLRGHGYAVALTTHDCGELGGLSQHRHRFLLVARHTRKVPPFLYRPPSRRVRSIGEAIGSLPMPDDPAAGPMHRIARLTWQTWVRLALIEAGKDWRSLQKLECVDGWLRDIAIVPASVEWHAGVYGVSSWNDVSGTVTSRSGSSNGKFSIADPRAPRDLGSYQSYGVVPWGDVARTVTGQAAAGTGPYSVQDPRMKADKPNFNNVFRLHRWNETSQAITAGTGPSSGGLSIQDPRCGTDREGAGKYKVVEYDKPAGTVIAASTTGNGAFAVQDPKWSGAGLGKHSGKMKVQPWSSPAGTVTCTDRVGSGAACAADPRVYRNGDRPDPVPRIIALDGTWHRPLTTMELAVLQSYPVFDAAGKPLMFAGTSDTAWREQIGNSVPPDAAHAIADEMARTLLLAALGEDFVLSATDVWVRPYVVAVSVSTAQSIASEG